MLTLNDGRSELWQWDTGRTLAVDADCSQVHFSNKVFGRSIDVDVTDGVAIIPDVLLQTDKDLNVWAFVGTAENGYTKISKTFKVNRRNKPADYVFTPPEQTTLAELSGRIDRIEESQDPDAIKNAVADYISKNPITVEETDPTVPAWAKEAQKPSYTASEVGADPSGTAESKVAAHNTGTDTHSDIRLLIQGLTDRINALGDSDDTTLDQLSEVVAYIKSNRGLIDAITTSKVSVSDIVDNLTTNVSNKPLSAAQGVALKALIDAISVPDKLPNPNALTFTGAVTGTYDGSAPLEVAIPSGGGTSGDYIPVPAAAEVGQTVVVKAVDETGKPTEWEAAYMASKGIDWQLVDSKTLTAADAVTELEWTGLDCDNIYFTSINQYGSNVTCTGIYVNGKQICKDFYQFEHVSAVEINTLLITKMPENHRAEVIGNNYSNITSIIYNKKGYIINIEKIDSIKFVFSPTLSAQMKLSLYKG